MAKKEVKHPDVHIAGTIEVIVSDSPFNTLFPTHDPHTGKPYLILNVSAPKEPPQYICLTTNIGEMIGGFAKGTRERWEYPSDVG